MQAPQLFDYTSYQGIRLLPLRITKYSQNNGIRPGRAGVSPAV